MSAMPIMRGAPHQRHNSGATGAEYDGGALVAQVRRLTASARCVSCLLYSASARASVPVSVPALLTIADMPDHRPTSITMSTTPL